MINRRNRLVALLLSFMMVALNLFSGTGALYSFADTETEEQPAAELTTDEEQAEEPTQTEETAEPIEEAAPAKEEPASEAPEAAEEEEAEEPAAEEAKEEAFDESETVDGVKINVSADEGVFPAGATLRVENLDEDEEADVKEAIDEEAGDADIAQEYLFDISVLDEDGNELQPEGTANVSFETSEVADESLEAKVFHVKDNGKAEELDVEAADETATVETTGFSAYALVFEHFGSSGSTGKYSLAYDNTVALKDIVAAVGITGKTISRAEADSTAPITLSGEGDDITVKMSTAAPTGSEHSLTVKFTDGTSASIVITPHKHNWNLTVDGNKATLKCNEKDCPYSGTYTATLSASDVTYNGNAQGAQLTQNLPHDCGVSSVSYYSGSTKLSSTPVNAGTYKAEVTISPDGGTAQTISTTYTIKKADINFTKEATPTYPEGATSLTYNGSDQTLYYLAAVKSATTSKTDFTVQYWYTNTPNDKHNNTRLTGKDAGTYKISYQAIGDDNHNNSVVKTLDVVIGQRPVYFTGITAQNRIYNSKTNATLNYNGLTMYQVVPGESLSVTATGTFDDKNVGENKTVTLSDIKLVAGDTSTKVENYILNTNHKDCQKTTKATITPKTIEFDWENAENFQYNGQPQAPTPVKRPGNAKTDDDKLVYEGDEVTAGITDDSWKTEIGNNYEAKVTNLTGKDAGNYTLPDHDSHVRAKFNIVARVLEVEWANTEVVYNGYEQKPTATLKTPVEGEDVQVVVTMDKTSKNAGTYIATASLTGEKASNYALNALTETTPFVIKKAPLTVKASGWIYYGDKVSGNDSIHELKYEIPDKSQFKGEDTQESVLGGTPRFETDYGSKYNLVDPVSDETHKYYLFPHFETAQNYEIDNEDGILTVYPKPVKLEWTHEHNGTKKAVSGEQAFTYDGKNHTYTAKVSDDSYVKVNGRNIDDEIKVTFQDNVQRDANAKTNTEKYVARAASLDNKNYALVEIKEDGKRTEKDVATREVDFTIAQLPVELSWTPSTFTYNAKDQRPTVKVANLQTNDNGDKDAAFEVKFDVEAKDDSDIISISAGDYTAKAINEKETGYLADENYSLLATPADPMSEFVSSSKFDYTINKAPLSIKSIAKTITYRDEAPKASEYELDVAGAGLQGDDTIESIGLDTSSLEFSCSYRKNDKPGSYAVVASMDAQEINNYTVNLENGTLQVNDKSLGLVAKGIAKGKNKGVISWNGVTGATSYEVYLAKCNKKGKAYKCKKVATVKGNKYTTKKLKKNTFYKFYVVAKTPSGNVYSSTGHFATGNKAGKLTNAKSLSVRNGSVSLSKGGKYTIGKSSKKAKKKLKWPGKSHGGNYRFMSDNTEVATVNGSGTITAVGSGWCRVYVQTTNGIWKTVQVYVR